MKTYRQKGVYRGKIERGRGLQSGDSVGVFHQFIPYSWKNGDATLDVCLGSLSCYKTVGVGIDIVNEWLQCGLENVYVHHLPFKYTQTSWTPETSSSPHVNLDRIFAPERVYGMIDSTCMYTFYIV